MASQQQSALSAQFDFQTIEPKMIAKTQADIIRTTKAHRRKETFTITLPPPNITGFLHIGHAFTSTLQDIMLRFKRQQGFITFGQPGIDHAGIATQIVVEKQLQGTTRQQLGRKAFIDKIWEWKEKSGGTILTQLKRLGMSVDWNTTRFTMDASSNAAVRRAFVTLYQEGLIYRAEKMVNWDPTLKTAVSDLEVSNHIENSHLWYIRYPLAHSSEFLTIATTRPETLFGDTAIALNPDDPRAKQYKGKTVILPLVGREIPIIFDSAIAMDKGSGVLKVTPAHSFEDFEIGQRHNLESINIFNDDATLNDQVPKRFQGMTCQQARQETVKALEEQGLLEKTEPISHSVPYNDRTGSIIEPRLTKQWFVDAKTLAKPAIEAVQSGRIRFIPDSWKNTYFEWMNNIQPWCISRQIWWGHQIPVWYTPDGEIFCAETENEAQQLAAQHFHCDVSKIPPLTQEEDVLDTWFSSGLWPFSTQYWPNPNEEIKARYPNNLMVTAFDIIFFWVARMIMLGLHFMKDVPFRDVYIHPLVRDAKGQKMSKSKGNVVDPLILMDKYGTDALRLTLASLAIPGRDIRISEALVENGRNFITKIWNAAKFLNLNQCKYGRAPCPSQIKESLNLWILDQLQKFQHKIKDAYETYRFDYAARYSMKFLRDIFCDVYIEGFKACTDPNHMQEMQSVATFVFIEFLKAAHPIIPFVTEYLADFFGFPENLCVSDWTMIEISDKKIQQTDIAVQLTQEIRSLRGLLNVPLSEKLNLYLKDPEMTDFVKANQHWISCLGRINEICLATDANLYLKIILNGFEFGMSYPQNTDINQVKNIVQKKIDELTQDCDLLKNKVNNSAFQHASPEKWQEDCDKLKQKTEMIEKLKTILR